MFEYYNNVLCIQASWLIENNIVSKDNYSKLCVRGHFKRMNIGGNGRKALIAFESIKDDIKKKVISLVGYDPTIKAKHITFADYIKTDEFAKDFFNSYTLESGDGLPEKNIKEYTANASILNAIGTVLSTTMSKRKALGSKVKPWEKIAAIVAELPQHTWPHSLPSNSRRLKDRYTLYLSEGYQSLIHKGFCHKNAEKINDDAKSWVLARWSDRVKKCTGYSQLFREYNEMALIKGWKQIKSDQSLMNFLQDPKIEPIWYGYRYGELKAKEKYSYQHTTKLPSMRDSLWYSDGTKLNYYYQENGVMKTCQVYEVFDAYSEVFLGYHISNTEDFEAQYHAFKMAVQISGNKPYEIKFDGQGGTKKLEAISFLGKISKLTTKTAPYNGKSKTIESAFGRFQQQYLKQDWFYSGQNITAKKLESKSNMEWILENSKNLPTLEEIKKTYALRRQQWNEAPHPKTGVSRLEMYLNSQNPGTTPISIWDMVDMFWITREKPVTCTAYGIGFTEKKVDYNFMVYDDNRMPDLKWLRENIDKKFIIKYDPDDMTLIHLFEQMPLGLRRVAQTETKTEVHRGQQEQEEFEASFIRQIQNENKRIRIEARDEMDAILAKHKMTPEHYGLNSPRLQGLETSNAQRKIRAKEKQKEKPLKMQKTSIGDYQKKISNASLEDTKEIDIYSLM